MRASPRPRRSPWTSLRARSRGGAVGVAYSQSVSASGGVAPYAYAVSTGTLPTGLSLDPASGAITGTPTATGTFSFTIGATDSSTTSLDSGSTNYTVSITPAPVTFAVTFAPGSSVADVTSSWTVGFTTSASGALATGDTITLTFAPGFGVPALASVSLLSGFTHCAALTTGTGRVLTMTLADSGGACSVPNGTALSILIPGITNAGAATYPGSSFSVATFVDATPASPASNVVITPAPVPGPPPTTEPGTPTTPTITNLPASGIYGGSFSATVGTNGDGTKSVTSSTMSVCTVSGFVVTYVAIGTCSLTAHVAAGRNYGAADGNAQSFMIGPATCRFSRSGLTEDLKIGTDCWNVSSIETSATGKTEAVQVTSHSLSLLNAMLQDNLTGAHIFPTLDIVNNVGRVVVSESLGPALVDSFTEDAGHSVTGQFSFGFTSPLKDTQTPATGRCSFSGSGLTEDLKISTDLAGKISTDCWNVSSIKTSATGKTEAVQVTSDSLSLLNAMLRENLAGAHIFPELDIVNNVGTVVVSESLGQSLVDSFTEDAGHSVTGQFSFGFTSLQDAQNISAPEISTMR